MRTYIYGQLFQYGGSWNQCDLSVLGKNPDSSDKFILVESFKMLVGTGSSKQDFVGALSTGFLKSPSLHGEKQ